MKTTHLQGVKWKASRATDQQSASRLGGHLILQENWKLSPLGTLWVCE